MKIAVFGAGAIGGTIAGKLTARRQDCAVIARGETVARLNDTGLTIMERGEEYRGSPTVIDSAQTATLGHQDIVILTTKAHQIESALPAIMPLVGPETLIVPAINGIPWWYTLGIDNDALNGRRLLSVDPNGALEAAFPADRTIGCVVYIAAEIAKPGIINSIGPRRLMLGGVTPAAQEKTPVVASILEAGDFRAPIETDIRKTVWEKLWGNLHANPISVLTAATMQQTVEDPYVRDVSRAMMAEAANVAGACGVEFGMSIDERLNQGQGLGNFKTSMLQDFEKGRQIELDAILGAVIELANILSIETPMMNAVYGLTRLRARTAGCYPAPN